MFGAPKTNFKFRQGFTLIEICVVAVFVGLLFLFFFLQKLNIDAMERDDRCKQALNAMYYALEEGFFPNNGHYPEKISESNLKMLDPALFTDPFGVNLGAEGSAYRYEPANCEDGKCKEYVLRAILEKEDIYVKKSRNNQSDQSVSP